MVDSADPRNPMHPGSFLTLGYLVAQQVTALCIGANRLVSQPDDFAYVETLLICLRQTGPSFIHAPKAQETG